MNYDYRKTAERLKKLRESKKLSHDKLSAEIEDQYGVSINRKTLMNYEKSDLVDGMSISKLRTLADFYDVSVSYILGTSNVPSVNPNVQVAVSTFGLSWKAAENLARISTETEDDNIFISLKKSAARDALNRILESEDVLWVAEATDHLLDIEKARPRNIL